MAIAWTRDSERKAFAETCQVLTILAHVHFRSSLCHLLGFAQEAGGHGFVRVGFPAVGTNPRGDVVHGQSHLAAFQENGGHTGNGLGLVADDALHFFLFLKPDFHWDGSGS